MLAVARWDTLWLVEHQARCCSVLNPEQRFCWCNAPAQPVQPCNALARDDWMRSCALTRYRLIYMIVVTWLAKVILMMAKLEGSNGLWVKMNYKKIWWKQWKQAWTP